MRSADISGRPEYCGPSWPLAVPLLLAGMIVAHVALILGNIRWNSPTYDEVGHIQAGVSYWKTWDFSDYRANPPLAKLLQALPVLLIHPDRDVLDIRADEVTTLVRVVNTARLAGIAWSLLGAWAIFRWANDLYGSAAGCLGLALWCFEPNVLAHASLATADIAATASAVAATYLFVRHLRSPGWDTALLAGVALGIAQATKFTMISLYGIWPTLYLIRRIGHPDGHSPILGLTSRPRWCTIFVTSIFTINYFYFFDKTIFPLSGIGLHDIRFAAFRRFICQWIGDLPIPLPLDYVAGFDGIGEGLARGQPSYLAGRWKEAGGWWYYYLYALAVKVPAGLLILVTWNLALSLLGRRFREKWREEAMLWIPTLGLLALVSSQTGLCKHMRYAFPALPFVMISTSKMAVCFRRSSRVRGGILATLLLSAIGSGLSAYPHGLSYFNEIAGGPLNGHAHLVDSNIDWGQDVLALKRWVDDHPEAGSPGMAIFQSIHLRRFGIDFTDIPPGPDALPTEDHVDPTGIGPQPGYFAISVNFLRGMIFEVPNSDGTWSMIDRHDYYDYFKYFEPIDRVGYSIYIYKITPAEANSVRARMGLPPVQGSRD